MISCMYVLYVCTYHECLHRYVYVSVTEPLTMLIDAARDSGVMFVYAISPGLDITYSSSKDVSCLKHKLEQVASFGCEAFAILFDDIDVELCDADKSLYQSFASAQACHPFYTAHYVGVAVRYGLYEWCCCENAFVLIII